MIRTSFALSLAVAMVASTAYSTQAADPWADNVVEYLPGTGISNDFLTGTPFDDATTVIGEPTRFTSDTANFGGATTPLQSAFRNDELVSIGEGGSLTVSFDEPVTDDPNNPYGIDLLIFGNSFLFGTFFNPDFSFNPAGTADGVASEGGIVELSDDGVNFVPVTNVEADGLYPTYGYADLLDPFPAVAGNVLTDFTKPVDPAFDVVGKTFVEIIAGYDGSGGGAGIDIGSLGFSQITYVRISNPMGATSVPEIDAFADVAAVPEPASLSLAGLMAFAGLLSRRFAKPY